MVPAKAIVRGDLRFIREEQKEAARAKMREIVAKSLPGAIGENYFCRRHSSDVAERRKLQVAERTRRR